MRYHTVAEIERRGWEAVTDRAVAKAREEGRKLVISFDIDVIDPALYPTYRTTQNSVYIIKACITCLAMRKKGLTDKHYLSPVSSEHAIDNYYGAQQKYLDATVTEEAKEEKKEEKQKQSTKKCRNKSIKKCNSQF